MTLEQVIVWCLYVAALEAQKRRRFRSTWEWRRDLHGLRTSLAADGLTL